MDANFFMHAGTKCYYTNNEVHLSVVKLFSIELKIKSRVATMKSFLSQQKTTKQQDGKGGKLRRFTAMLFFSDKY